MGILAGMGTAKYFDLQEQSERKAALASVAEAQSRLNLRFGDLLMQGNSCTQIVKTLSELSSVADSTDASGAVFGDFILSGGAITTSGTAISAQRISTSGKIFETGASLYLPACDGTLSIASGLEKNMQTIVKAMLGQTADYPNRARLDSGAPATSDGKTEKSDGSNLTGTELAKRYLASQNPPIDLDALGAKSWTWLKSTNSFYWTSKDISTNTTEGETVTVTKYNPDSNPQYSTTTATITKKYVNAKGQNKTTNYFLLSPND